ncbi:MAG: hypothetical protein IKY31_02155 [Bacteroidaceae bacterium]|nr:hypothetical protein [Bacteroidaceae bacterium]
MNEKITIPYQYKLCIASECPMASTCLRQVAFKLANELALNIFNPRALDTSGGCKHYVKSEKVLYAKGFKGVMDKLPFKVHDRAATYLMAAFSERTYYRIRKGERLLSPDEQIIVRNIITRVGYTEPWEFDAYVEDFLW